MTAAKRGNFVPRVMRTNARAAARSRSAALSARKWATALTWFGGKCAYCGTPAPPDVLTIDHIIPLADPLSPGNVTANLVPACEPCNTDKGSRTLADWLITRFGADRAAEILERIDLYQEMCGHD